MSRPMVSVLSCLVMIADWIVQLDCHMSMNKDDHNELERSILRVYDECLPY